MIRLTRIIFAQNVKNTYFIRKNSSKSQASKLNKFEVKDDTNKADTLFAENLLDSHKKVKSDINKSSLFLKKEDKFSAIQLFKNSSDLLDAKEVDKVTELLTPFQAVETLKVLAVSRKRHPLLLKALYSKVKLGIKDFNFKTYADIMYCAAVLSFKDTCFLNDVADLILKFNNIKLTERLATTILLSCGKLKYRNCELIDHMLNFVISNNSANKTLLTGLITLGITNYISQHALNIIDVLSKIPINKFSQTPELIDFVWACILINQFPIKHISACLSESYIENMKVFYGFNKFFGTTYIKLLNINAAAKYLIPSYDGPKMIEENFIKYKVDNSHSKFFLNVIDDLNHVFPNSKYIKTNVNTGAGFLLDAECYVDNRSKPLLLKKGDEGIKIGIMLILFKNTCLGNSKTLCGTTNFQKKILKAQGYKIIQIFWDEYNANLILQDKVEYLKKKLKECISL